MTSVSKYTWRRRNPIAMPAPARPLAAMAYDAKRRQIVFFDGGTISATWVWDGQVWDQVHPPVSPPPRTSAAIVYDAAREQVVLFGGVGTDGRALNDTWVWDGTIWAELISPSFPTARSGAAMAFDGARQQVVLFGGTVQSVRQTSPSSADTWVWNGSDWTQMRPLNSPPGRCFASMAYEAVHQEIVLFGGLGAVPGNLADDTWIWNGLNWTQRHPSTAPSARYCASMVYNAESREVMLIAGSTPAVQRGAHDTWAWDGSTWIDRTSDLQPGGPYTLTAYDDARKIMIVLETQIIKASGNSKMSWKPGVVLERPTVDIETHMWSAGQ